MPSPVGSRPPSRESGGGGGEDRVVSPSELSPSSLDPHSLDSEPIPEVSVPKFLREQANSFNVFNGGCLFIDLIFLQRNQQKAVADDVADDVADTSVKAAVVKVADVVAKIVHTSETLVTMTDKDLDVLVDKIVADVGVMDVAGMDVPKQDDVALNELHTPDRGQIPDATDPGHYVGKLEYVDAKFFATFTGEEAQLESMHIDAYLIYLAKRIMHRGGSEYAIIDSYFFIRVTIQHPIRPINPARRSAAVTNGEDDARLQPAVQRRSGEESVSLSLSLLVPSLSTIVVKRATVKKGAQVAKIPNPRAAAAAENIKQGGGEQRVDLGLPIAIDLGAGKEASAKAQNGGERKCETAATNVIIISTETSNGRAVKERSRKKKTGGRPTFTSLLIARSKEAAAIGGVARKQEDLIIVNIDEAFGDDELAVAEYAEDIYKFYKLTEGESQVCDYMGKQPDIDERRDWGSEWWKVRHVSEIPPSYIQLVNDWFLS
ncbi:hypothetical protein Dimus_016186 [Dionaea muscipula]